MNLTVFILKRYKIGGKNYSSVNIRFAAKTSDIRNFSQNIRFLTSRKFITAWFDNKCVAAPCGTAEEDSAMNPISTSKKTNINILSAKGGLEPLQPHLWLRL